MKRTPLKRKTLLKAKKGLDRGEGPKRKKKWKPKRKVTGERELFVQLWAKCGGKCQVTGLPLLPPEHPMFHCQGSHLLPKGHYGKFRLREDNIVMCLKSEHDRWAEQGPERLLDHPQWGPFVRRYFELRSEYERRSRNHWSDLPASPSE